ncbi:4-hydroxythreonine-4-phosphate dehydrogenase PdxA [Viridibacterium curvum]|uniref:4-hydroxythreonine-4-phosphate dehydrogenase n=1 Tax=Viridibacterium curvum TaxID=1101404 RepID=A0ABP9R7X6_9RHOO
MTAPLIAITSGEPAGIGPELCAVLAAHEWPVRPVVIGDLALITARVACTDRHVAVRAFDASQPPVPGMLDVLHVPLDVASEPGVLDTRNAAYVIRTLDVAVEGCRSGHFAAMVTAPVQKNVINDAGIPFTGHTEYLADQTQTPRVVMMLAGEYGEPRRWMRVAVATTHLPLAEVPAAITPDLLEDSLRIMHKDLRDKFGLVSPRILVSGLNPHAGEGGHMGREEIDVIQPVLDKLRAEGLQLIGPLPADTLFVPHQLERGDAVLAMYHDQGLATLKFATFGGGINVTLGLPFIRTSVDHGTALDLAGKGCADPGSLIAAMNCAINMLGYRS